VISTGSLRTCDGAPVSTDSVCGPGIRFRSTNTPFSTFAVTGGSVAVFTSPSMTAGVSSGQTTRPATLTPRSSSIVTSGVCALSACAVNCRATAFAPPAVMSYVPSTISNVTRPSSSLRQSPRSHPHPLDDCESTRCIRFTGSPASGAPSRPVTRTVSWMLRVRRTSIPRFVSPSLTMTGPTCSGANDAFDTRSDCICQWVVRTENVPSGAVIASSSGIACTRAAATGCCCSSVTLPASRPYGVTGSSMLIRTRSVTGSSPPIFLKYAG
jgi:hypothetical protein